MDYRRLINSLSRIGFGIAVLAVIPWCRAEIKLAGAGLRVGRSPRLSASDWAYLHYSLDNDEDREVTVRLTLQSSRLGRAVYEKIVTVGPRARLTAREPVTAAASETYSLSIFRDGKRIIRTDFPSRYTDPMVHCRVLFMNDSPEFSGASQLAESGLLREPMMATMTTAALSPHHWAAFGHARALVMIQPEYRDLSALQYAAIIEYVHRGGTLVFAHPAGTLKAAETPLKALLPVTPMRVRLVEDLPELDAWGAAWWEEEQPSQSPRRPLVDPDGFHFLESVAAGNGMTLLQHAEFPIIRWRRCGLGRVGMIAIDPCHGRIAASGVEVPLWNHVLAWSRAPFAMRNFSNSRILPAVLSQLTGFRIPSVGVIAGILWGYVVLVVVILVGGHALGRHVLAWVSSAVLGLVLTTGIFVAAMIQNADRAPRSAALLDLRMSSGKRTTGHRVVSLFTKHDMRPTLRDGNPENLLRPLPSAARGKRKEPLDAPLIVQRRNDLPVLPDMNLNALRPRAFASIHTDRPAPLEEEPVLVFSTARPRLHGVRLPATWSRPGVEAYLLAASSLIALNRQGDEWQLPPDTRRLMQFNPFMQHLSEYLVRGGFPSPALVVLRPWDETRRDLSLTLEGFEQRGYGVEFLPVTTQVAGAAVAVPAEFIALRPAGNFTRMQFVDGTWRSDVLRRPQVVLPVEVVLPSALSTMRLDTVTVDLEYSNAGGNIAVVPRLTRIALATPSSVAMMEPERAWLHAIAHEREQNGVFTFSDIGETPLMQPLYGSFRLLVQVSQKDIVRDGFDADRSNRYRITRLRVSLTGHRDSDALSKRF